MIECRKRLLVVNRRSLLKRAAGTVAAGVGAYHLRADIYLDPRLFNPNGKPTETVVTPGSEHADAIGLDDPLGGSWKRAARFAASSVAIRALRERTGEPDVGLTYGTRALLFGLVVEITHGTAYDETGAVVGEPVVGFGELRSKAPTRVTVTVETEEGQESARVPVVVRRNQIAQQ